jgi:hypothetical protein
MTPSTPSKGSKRKEHDTIKRMRFFDAYDRKRPSTGLNSIAKRPNINIPSSTARRWLKQRDQDGNKALRKTRRSSSSLGRKSTASAHDLNRITDQDNPLH